MARHLFEQAPDPRWQTRVSDPQQLAVRDVLLEHEEPLPPDQEFNRLMTVMENAQMREDYRDILREFGLP